MKTAVIQLKSTGDKEKNIEKALCFVREAIKRRAEFILLPEAFNFRGKSDSRKGFKDIAERVPGPSLKPFMEVAKEHKVSILAGSICERIPGEKKVFNTSVLIDARGCIVAKYRKIHLFDARIGRAKLQESLHFAAGSKAVMANIGTWKAGLSICYDLRFPAMYLKCREKGAHVLCVPSAFTKLTGQAHWETLLRARAIENMCYVLAPNQIGKNGEGVLSYGNSMMIDPWGKIMARASGDREEIIFSDLSKKVIKERRAVLGF